MSIEIIAVIAASATGAGVAFWKQSNNTSRSVGKLEGKIIGVREVVEAKMEACATRIDDFREDITLLRTDLSAKVDTLSTRVDSLANSKKPGRKKKEAK